ncbi:hypothetical protein EV196_103211 [Mariniflexile fucanivorans]|uniref:Uncharacterized protein n=1 Tax=Mariniflexile fucanivorans TaxID=264023 RepID=A0A4R1RKR5_9FLAO|nr:hypothetical protein EV196_103211 [Mariniflexile fucanivorans]
MPALGIEAASFFTIVNSSDFRLRDCHRKLEIFLRNDVKKI